MTSQMIARDKLPEPILRWLTFYEGKVCGNGCTTEPYIATADHGYPADCRQCGQPLGLATWMYEVGTFPGRHEMPVQTYLFPADLTDRFGYGEELIAECERLTAKWLNGLEGPPSLECVTVCLYYSGLSQGFLGAIKVMHDLGVNIVLMSHTKEGYEAIPMYKLFSKARRERGVLNGPAARERAESHWELVLAYRELKVLVEAAGLSSQPTAMPALDAPGGVVNLEDLLEVCPIGISENAWVRNPSGTVGELLELQRRINQRFAERFAALAAEAAKEVSE